MTKYWFDKKRYGYGWVPCTWEGWLTTAVFIVLFVLWAMYTINKNYLLYISGTLVLIFILILICRHKGPKPSWQWGSK